MMKKSLKILFVAFLFLSISFLVLNCLSLKLKTVGRLGTWAYSAGEYRCMGAPDDCIYDGIVY